MLFKIIHNNGEESYVGGGCYGCLGRTDSYKPYDSVFDEVCEINEANDFSTDEYDTPGWRSESRSPAKYLVLERNFYSESGKTFHSSRRPLMEYLFHRSPYSVCFKNESVDQIMEEERILLDCVDVSSELVIALGYILRAMDEDRFFLTWSTVSKAVPDESEFLQVHLAFCMRDLYRGTPYANYLGGGDGILLPEYIDAARLLNGNPNLSGLSIGTVGGYVMNVLGMWKGEFDLDSCIRKACRKHSGMTEVQGVFGPISVNGVTDIRSFLKDIINDLKGAM